MSLEVEPVSEETELVFPAVGADGRGEAREELARNGTGYAPSEVKLARRVGTWGRGSAAIHGREETGALTSQRARVHDGAFGGGVPIPEGRRRPRGLVSVGRHRSVDRASPGSLEQAEDVVGRRSVLACESGHDAPPHEEGRDHEVEHDRGESQAENPQRQLNPVKLLRSGRKRLGDGDESWQHDRHLGLRKQWGRRGEEEKRRTESKTNDERTCSEGPCRRRGLDRGGPRETGRLRQGEGRGERTWAKAREGYRRSTMACAVPSKQA